MVSNPGFYIVNPLQPTKPTPRQYEITPPLPPELDLGSFKNTTNTSTRPPPQNKDAHFTSLHLHRARDADLLEAFAKDRLPADDIYVPAHHQPVNPEDEDDVVPDQHAAFGIQKATALRREPAWRDFGLAELMAKGPEPGAWGKGGAGAAARGKGAGGAGAAGKKGSGPASRLPR